MFRNGFKENPQTLASKKGQKFIDKPVIFWGLATAFEDFQLNNLENLKKLIRHGEVVGETLYTLRSQGMIENNCLSYTIPFPVAWDKIIPADPSNASADSTKMIERDFPEFEKLPESSQKKIMEQVMSYYSDKKFSASTFEKYQMRGTPSTLMIDQTGVLRGKWFGSGFGLTKEIQDLLAK
jgi:hypothetical protein